MSDHDTREAGADLPAARDALRIELTTRGHRVASDTLGPRMDLYIVGPNDLAKALFEFKDSVPEALDTMYQGSWVASLPPRFAVLPSETSRDPSMEMLEQIRVIPLFFDAGSGGVTFGDLDRLLAEHVAEDAVGDVADD